MPEITAFNPIDNLHHVRAAIVGPFGKPELHSPDALDAILAEQGEVYYLGTIGTRRSHCLTLDGPRTFDYAEIHPVGVLPDYVQRELLDAYTATVRPQMEAVAWLEGLYALPDTRSDA